MRRLSSIVLCLALAFGAVAPSALADDQQLFAGEITGVDVAGEQIFLKGNVVLHVTYDSELFDRSGDTMTLQQLEATLPAPDENGATALDAVPYAFYKFAPRLGKLYVRQLTLGKIPR